MKIPIIFVTGQVGYINGETLDRLIREKEVVAFCRSDGWVQIGRDPTRGSQKPLTNLGNRRSDFMPKRIKE